LDKLNSNYVSKYSLLLQLLNSGKLVSANLRGKLGRPGADIGITYVMGTRIPPYHADRGGSQEI